jgi:hypothetical protein
MGIFNETPELIGVISNQNSVLKGTLSPRQELSGKAGAGFIKGDSVDRVEYLRTEENGDNVYRIYIENGEHYDFTAPKGNGISSIETA